MESKSVGAFLKVLGVVLAGLSVLGGIILALASDYMAVTFLLMGLLSGGTMMIITGLGCIVCDVAEIKEQSQRSRTNSSTVNSKVVTVSDELPEL